MAPRRTPVVLLIAVLTVAACGSASPPAPTAAALSTPAPSVSTGTPIPSVAPSTEPAATPNASDPLGTLIGSIDSGRILIGIEGSNGASFAYIDSTGLHEITTDPDRTMAHGVWASPDTIIFDSERAGSRHLFRMTIADGTVTPLTTGAGQERAGVSTDGKRVVSDDYDTSARNRDLGLQIWSSAGVAIDTVTPLGDTAGTTGASQASFSPDGRSIAFVQKSDFDADRGAIFVVDAAGGQARRLTPDADHVAYPRWSPDGRSILFTQGGGPLLLIDVGSGTVRPLVDPGQGSVAFEGDWSPDGTQIAYAYWNPGLDQNQLWIASSDGTHQRALWVGYTAGIGTPDWGP